MAFNIAYADPADGTRLVSSVVSLSPRPTKVNYPTEPLSTFQSTLSGGVIVQQPLVDNRVREWIWENYPDWNVNYRILWGQIEPLRSRYRALAGDTYRYVYLQDTETTALRTVSVTGHVVTSTSAWLKARVLDVSRVPRQEGSSLVVWAQTILRFSIEDSAYNDLG